MKRSAKIHASVMFDTLELQTVPEDAFGLVNRFYKCQGDKSKAKRGELVIAAYQGQSMVAVMRLLPKAESWWLMRSVCVASHLRGAGIGSFIVEKGLDRASVNRCYCFALAHVGPFYQRLKFQTVAVDATEIPVAVRDDIRRVVAAGKPWLPMMYQRGELEASSPSGITAQ